LITEEVKQKFRPAYIELFEVGSDLNRRRTVPFQLNAPDFVPPPALDLGNKIVADDAKDLRDEADFWVHLVVSGYQAKLAEDKDPDNEQQVTGETFDAYDLSVIYLETIRDSEKGDSTTAADTRRNNFLNILCGTIAHEIAHAPARRDDHPEGGLQNNDSCSVEFTAKSKWRFRKTPSWQAKW
jgi:hypothetical protein